MTDKEIYSMIFLPGFSTKDKVTEFSGRGVGMDVVVKNIETVGGKVSVESAPGRGCVSIMRFPITLAIIEGMNIRVGQSLYTIPITDIKQSFRPQKKDIITDPNGNEMLLVRGSVYPVVRLHEIFGVKPDSAELENGIIIMAESGENVFCIFADELLGQQEVVVKALPDYVKTTRGLAGCTLLGDGQISLILDTANLVSLRCAV
jgi:two-component system chemotaxis sensor kinase CheA